MFSHDLPEVDSIMEIISFSLKNKAKWYFKESCSAYVLAGIHHCILTHYIGDPFILFQKYCKVKKKKDRICQHLSGQKEAVGYGKQRWRDLLQANHFINFHQLVPLICNVKKILHFWKCKINKSVKKLRILEKCSANSDPMLDINSKMSCHK